jgi:hypothetical protein
VTNYHTIKTQEINLSKDRLSTSATFDAVLLQPRPGPDMYKLRLDLRLRLQSAFPSETVKDHDGNEFLIRPWLASEWQTFMIGARAAANMWNNRFWLKPPAGVQDYNFMLRDQILPRRWRPYFICELYVDLNADRADAHRTIDVYNLDWSERAGAPDGNTFRSDSLHWDSLDGTPRMTGIVDDHGVPIQHNTIAHEIGHMIGQPHIGVMMKTPGCTAAMDINGMEGQNQPICYNTTYPSSAGMNVMGMGSAFTEANAIPWQWAIGQLRGKSYYEHWQVLTTKPSTSGEEVPHVGADL